MRRIHPDRVLTPHERSKRYRDKHPDKIRAYSKKYAADPAKKALRREISLRAHHRDPVRKLLQLAKGRAKKAGLAFTLTREDIVIPGVCPVFGRPLSKGRAGFNDWSPTLDRVDNTKGYVKGNVLVVSWRANRLKADATTDEIICMAEFWKNWKAT